MSYKEHEDKQAKIWLVVFMVICVGIALAGILSYGPEIGQYIHKLWYIGCVVASLGYTAFFFYKAFKGVFDDVDARVPMYALGIAWILLAVVFIGIPMSIAP
jgi:hypothetical protein